MVSQVSGSEPSSALGPVGKVKQAVRRGIPSRAEVEDLRARVRELEEAVAECRRHHHRTAELTDLVQALLVPLATRDDAALQQVLREYTDQLG
ncbi:hypothetical protein GCM10023226_12140 [Nocardioides nanhaiensis]|uniref:DUF6752 domain-containing protein n=1 Tax=Nocardioides nanhaiensis TaxID=1476871 RepID=A0ABP8VZJ5_9ACTN